MGDEVLKEIFLQFVTNREEGYLEAIWGNCGCFSLANFNRLGVSLRVYWVWIRISRTTIDCNRRIRIRN